MEGLMVDETQTEIPRAKRKNPENYTDLEFSVRDDKLKNLQEKYPRIPYGWLEWLYDTLKHKSPEEIQEIIETKRWETPMKNDRMKGGVIPNAIEVLPPPTLAKN